MSFNKVILMGNLGADPKVSNKGTEQACCSFSLATNERKKENGELVDTAIWHNVVAFGQLADTCAEILAKGSPVIVEGKIAPRKWEGKDGTKNNSYEIVASTVQRSGSRAKTAAAA